MLMVQVSMGEWEMEWCLLSLFCWICNFDYRSCHTYRLIVNIQSELVKVKETGIPGGNHRLTPCRWQLSHMPRSSTGTRTVVAFLCGFLGKPRYISTAPRRLCTYESCRRCLMVVAHVTYTWWQASPARSAQLSSHTDMCFLLISLFITQNNPPHGMASSMVYVALST